MNSHTELAESTERQRRLMALNTGEAAFECVIFNNGAPKKAPANIKELRAKANSDWSKPIARATVSTGWKFKMQSVLNMLDDGDGILTVVVKRVA